MSEPEQQQRRVLVCVTWEMHLAHPRVKDSVKVECRGCGIELCMDPLNLPRVMVDKFEPHCLPCASKLAKDDPPVEPLGAMIGGTQRRMPPRIQKLAEQALAEGKLPEGGFPHE